MFLADLRGKDTHKVEKENLLEREPDPGVPGSSRILPFAQTLFSIL